MVHGRKAVFAVSLQGLSPQKSHLAHRRGGSDCLQQHHLHPHAAAFVRHVYITLDCAAFAGQNPLFRNHGGQIPRLVQGKPALAALLGNQPHQRRVPFRALDKLPLHPARLVGIQRHVLGCDFRGIGADGDFTLGAQSPPPGGNNSAARLQADGLSRLYPHAFVGCGPFHFLQIDFRLRLALQGQLHRLPLHGVGLFRPQLQFPVLGNGHRRLGVNLLLRSQRGPNGVLSRAFHPQKHGGVFRLRPFGNLPAGVRVAPVNLRAVAFRHRPYQLLPLGRLGLQLLFQVQGRLRHARGNFRPLEGHMERLRKIRLRPGGLRFGGRGGGRRFRHGCFRHGRIGCGRVGCGRVGHRRVRGRLLRLRRGLGRLFHPYSRRFFYYCIRRNREAAQCQ